uniref:Uncharacterized protein n=2 Tax=unclassified Caudoviricetes TaxID=2788787 RepID=A0A8S5QK36_9CAUD|nr:MAG TPA: hypothetical protein [Siphoviridae sp. ctVii20]DAE19362.1 MAG TPA: hypothetical protein [Siphoviridae sp. ctezl47]
MRNFISHQKHFYKGHKLSFLFAIIQESGSSA